MNGSRRVVCLIAICLISTSMTFGRSSEEGSNDGARRSRSAGQVAGLRAEVAESVEAVTLPMIAECDGILTLEMFNGLKGQVTDPLEVPRAWKRAGVMMPTLPLYNCLHEAWLLANEIHLNLAGEPSFTFPTSWSTEPELSLFLGPVTVSLNIPLPWTGDRTTSGFVQWQNEPSIAVDPTRTTPARLVAASNTLSKDTACLSPLPGTTSASLNLYATANGDQPPQTARWTYACAPWPTAIVPVCGTQCSYSMGDPSVAWDTDGFGYASYLLISNCLGCSFPTFANSVGAAKYNPISNSWSPLTYVVNRFADNTSRPDKPFIHIDTSPVSPFKNRIYVTWAEAYGPGSFDQSKQYLAYSSDKGLSWSTPVVLDSPGNLVAVNGGNITTDRNGTVYALWQRWTGDNPETSILARSTTGGASWTQGTAIYTHNDHLGTCDIRAEDKRGINAFGALDSDNNPASLYSGRLYFVTNDIAAGYQCTTPTCTGPPPQGSINVLLFYSDNQGQTWTQTQSPGGTVNQPPDAAGASANHFLPWLSVDPDDGTVNVVWYDTRGFSSNNYSTQMFYARSKNGGQFFEQNILLTDAGMNFQNQSGYSSENPCLNHNGPKLPDQQGEYIGVAAANRKVYYVATDTRQFWSPLDSALKEDIATSFVTNCSPPVWDALAPTAVCDSSAGAVNLSWHPGTDPGTGATSIAYHVYRSTSSSCPTGGTEVTPAAGISGTSITDSTGTGGTTYYYYVVAKNDCQGTPLTAMSVTSACSPGIAFPTVIDPTIYFGAAKVCAGSTGNTASAPSAPAGSTYLWTIQNGTPTGGTNTSQVVTFTAGSLSPVTLNLTVTRYACSRSAIPLAIPLAQGIASNSIAPAAGMASICLGGSGITMSVTDSPVDVSTTYQWGYRTVTGGAITPMNLRTGPSYVLTASDFLLGARDYLLVCTSTRCGVARVSNEKSVRVTSSTAPPSPIVTAPFSAAPGASGLSASVPNSTGVTYSWNVVNGSIVSGGTTRTLTFQAGGPSFPFNGAGLTVALQNAETSTGTGCVSVAGVALTQIDFLDVPGGPTPDPLNVYVNKVAKNGISAGCGSGNYCPTLLVTRAQMAVFLLKAAHGPGYTPPSCTGPPGQVFADVSCPSQFADWIQELAAEGITSGCGGGNYCPTASVDRQTMAVLLLKARFGSGHVPPACTPPGIFTDVACPTGLYVNWIEELKTLNITGGCNPSPLQYCPVNPVSRGAMAVFITNTWNLQ